MKQPSMWGRKDPWGRFRTGLGILLVVLLVGTGGYVALGLDPLDAVYQTVITISTVGYREIGVVVEDYQRFQIFTVILILFGAGTSLFTLGVLIETMFEGRLNDQFRRRHMQRKIDRLAGHVVLCGQGQVGLAIEDELMRAGERVVSVAATEPDQFQDVEGHLMVIGDATDDHVLLQAGLDRARTLVVALDSDVDNLFIVLSARSINPDLYIVARANLPGTVPKLHQAGADRVVNPHQIGGARMAALVSHPQVSEFLDVVMKNGEFEVRLAEIDITVGSSFADRSLAECAIRSTTGATVLAVRRGEHFITNPSRHFVLMPQDLLVSLGTEEHLEALRVQARKG